MLLPMLGTMPEKLFVEFRLRAESGIRGCPGEGKGHLAPPELKRSFLFLPHMSHSGKRRTTKQIPSTEISFVI
jgi:hypothetical protein